MSTPVTPFVQPDITLQGLKDALSRNQALDLTLTYAGRTIRPGYHVTEIKSARLSTLDCGGNPDAWSETVLQVEDLPAGAGQQTMSVGKFLSILARVQSALDLDATSRVTFEVSRPGEAMQVFDVAGLTADANRVALDLASRPAICKPRHRAALAEAACCGQTQESVACCA